MYLSLETMLNLGILAHNFPDQPMEKRPAPNEPTHYKPTPVNAIHAVNRGCDEPSGSPDILCLCPQCSVAPQRPSQLPFDCKPENSSHMKSWLLKWYTSSTFSTCPHDALPCMEGLPVEIHIDPSATPKACHTAAKIPLHWQERVHHDLLRDKALNMIECVPYDEPVTWCHRMVITGKHDGSPRRTVDLSPLNKFCERKTFATESPFHLARCIPKDTWKTVTYAWNGYHGVLLRESDHSSHPLAAGATLEPPKDSSPQVMGIIVTLTLS